MKKKALRLESLILVLTLVVSCLVPGFGKAVSNIEASAAATHEIDITDASGNSVTGQIKVMESEQVQLSYKLIDCSMPTGGYVVWKSDTPLNASVDQTGLVRGHDSSKGAAVRLWLENDVKSVPIIGKTLAKTLESVLYSENVNLDTMDTESIVTLVGETLGGGAVADSLMDSLTERLNNLDTEITIYLYDQFDNLLATDTVHVLVNNSDQWYANVFPNGAFILNKDSLPTTVAVGGKLTLEGGVTPLRLGYGVTWELEASSILEKAEDYATFDASTGEITFLKTGKVSVKVYPNADEIVGKLMGYINDLAALGNEVDTSDVAEIMVKVLGLNVSVSTVKFAIDILVAVAGMGTNTADMVSQATKYVANWILEASINDKITFNIVDSLELKSFSIGGTLEVEEGKTSQLYITDVVPAGANSTNIVWSVADESIAYVDKYGILIGRDAGGISSLNKKTTIVTATVDGISASAEVTVKGKLVTQPVDIKISGPSVVELGSTAQYSATVYPDRSNATIRWGLINSEGEAVFAKDGSPVSNDFGTIDSDGNFTSINGGTTEIVAKAGTISTCQRTFTVYIGTLVKGFDIDQGDYLSIEVPGTKTYNSMSTQLTVTFNPPDASNQNIRWSVLEGNNIEVSTTGVVKPSKNRAAWGVIQAESFDGGYIDTITVSFANYPVTGVSISPSSADLIVGNTVDITETVQPVGTGATGAKIGDASVKDIRWTSSDNNVATVDGNGVVTAVDAGTCVITATTRDGGFEATSTITVRADKTRLNYAIQLFESGKVTAENCNPSDWAALEAAYNQALAIKETEFAYQSSCDKAAQQIISLYDRVGAYVNLYGVDILLGGESAPAFNSVKVDTSKYYTSYSVDFDHAFKPENAMYASIEWKSSNPELLPVDQNGVCKPAKNQACWAEITFTAVDYMGNVVSDSVIVSFANYPVNSVTLDRYNINGLVYNSDKLTATVGPRGTLGIGDASIKDVMWSSSNTEVATVDSNGNITYKNPGTAVITVTTVDGGYTAVCIVKVSVNKTMLSETIAEMDAYQLDEEQWTKASFDEYSKAYNHAMSIMDDDDVTQKKIDDARQDLIDAYKGLVKFIKTDSVIIQVKENDTLVEAPEYISVDTIAYASAKLQLYSRILPLDSMYVSVEWSTDSSSIVVDENGLVKPKSVTSAGYGWVTITVTDERGNVVTDKVHVSFGLSSVTDLILTPEVIETSLDEAPAKIVAECRSGVISATIQKVYWTSDNESVVTVDANGQLTYHNAGQATITATAADGGMQKTCLVTVAGDKSVLRQAIAKADEEQIDIQEFEYQSSMAYVAAYEHAKEVESSVLYSQEEIDAAAEALFNALDALTPYIHLTDLNVYYNGSVAPDFIAIKVSSLSSIKNQKITLSYDYAPADAMYKSIEWSSSDSTLSVNNGVVQPTVNKSCGAGITLTATDHYGNKVEKTVYVAFSNYEPTGISIDRKEMLVPYGAESQTITATVSHSTTDYIFDTYGISDVVWRTTDPDVATVQNGVVTFVEAGTCQILASTVYGGHTAVCEVTVTSDKYALEEAYSKSTYVIPRKDEYSVESWEPFAEAYEKAQQILAMDNPKQRDIDAAAQALNEAYDNLDRYVKVTKVNIKYNNYSDYTHIPIKVGTAAIYTNQSIILAFESFPSNATYEKFEWTSSNDSVSVDKESGVCKPTKNEACWSIITVTLTDKKDRTFTDSVYVSFAKNQVEGVSVSYDTSSNAIVGGKKQLSANINPDKANIKDVVWSSGDESLAVVDANGVVTFLNTGTVEICATTCDGGYKAFATIKIYANKTELNEVITHVNSLDYTKFTPASWAALQEKYNVALALYNAEDPTQEEVNNAKAALSEALLKLVEYVYISEVKISCDGNTSENINVIVPEDKPYLSSYANVGFEVYPENAMYASVKWSYDGSIIHNPGSGIVGPSINAPCFGKIYLTVVDDFGNEYKTTSYVTFARNPVESVELNFDLIETVVNADPIQLEASVIGVNGGLADIPEVIWTSSNPNVASVDNNGLVTFIAGGYTEIKAESIVGTYHAICKVYVTTDKSALEAILQKTIDENYQRTDYVETTYEAYLEAYDNAVNVYSNNEASQAEIDNATEWLTNAIDALATYVHVESIVITANSNSNLTVNGDHFTYEDPGSIVSNRTIQLNCTLNPGNAMYESITWQSDNSDISVDQNGLVKSLTNTQQAAAITITVTDYYGVKYVKTVHVSFIKFASASVSGVTISHSEISGSSGGSFKLTHEIQKSGWGDPEITSVIWTSSDESVAKVNPDGTVYFIDSGECYVTVTTVQGGYSASCKVTVTATEAKMRLAEAIARAKAYDPSLYTEDSFAILTEVIPQAEEVYGTHYATTTRINEAIALIENAESQLVYVPANYTVVEDAIDSFNALNRDYYKAEDLQAIQTIIDGINYDLDVSEQNVVNQYAADINEAIANLVQLDADYEELLKAIERANGVNRDIYDNITVIDAPLANAVTASETEYKISQQSELDAITDALNSSLDSLVLKTADKKSLNNALKLKLSSKYTEYYDAELLAVWEGLVAEGQEIVANDELTILDNEMIKEKAQEIMMAYADVEASYNFVIDTSVLEEAVASGNEIIVENYVEDETLNEFLSAMEEGKNLLASELETEEDQVLIRASAQRITDAIAALNIKTADYSAVNVAIERFEAVDKIIYTDDSVKAVQDLIDAINWELKVTEQDVADKYAEDINAAIDNLVPIEETKIVAIESMGSTVSAENKFIYGVDEGMTDVEDYVRVVNGSVDCTETENGLGTGSVIDVLDENGEVVDSYTLVIFGDVNGDGIVDGQDSLLIWMIIWSGDIGDEAIMLAADANKDGVIDETDAELVEQAGVYNATVEQR